jgi:hypothetical protein
MLTGLHPSVFTSSVTCRMQSTVFSENVGMAFIFIAYFDDRSDDIQMLIETVNVAVVCRRLMTVLHGTSSV